MGTRVVVYGRCSMDIGVYGRCSMNIGVNGRYSMGTRVCMTGAVWVPCCVCRCSVNIGVYVRWNRVCDRCRTIMHVEKQTNTCR
jgi:hypothetical protein